MSKLFIEQYLLNVYERVDDIFYKPLLLPKRIAYLFKDQLDQFDDSFKEDANELNIFMHYVLNAPGSRPTRSSFDPFEFYDYSGNKQVQEKSWNELHNAVNNLNKHLQNKMQVDANQNKSICHQNSPQLNQQLQQQTTMADAETTMIAAIDTANNNQSNTVS